MARRRERLEQLLEAGRDGSSQRARAQLAKDTEERFVRARLPADADAQDAAAFRSRVRDEVARTLRRCARTTLDERHMEDLERRVEAIPVPKKRAVASDFASRGGGDEALPPVGIDRGNQALPNDDYQVLMEHDRVCYLISEQEKRTMQARKKLEIRAALDKQVADRQRRRAEEEKEAEELGRRFAQEVKDYEAAERKRQQDARARFLAEKEEREEQMKRSAQANELRQQRIKRQEELELLRNREELEAARQKNLEQKRAQAAYVAQVQLENAKQRKLRDEQKRSEWEMDAKRNEAYAQKLLKDELDRAQALERLKQRSSQNQKLYQEATADREARLQADLERAESYRLQRQADEDRRTAAKEAQRRAELADIHKTLSEQMAAKERRAAEERAAVLEQARLDKAQAEKQRELNRRAEDNKRRQAQRLREALDEQVRSKKQLASSPTRMSRAEKHMNAQRFARIHDDPMTVALVKQNLKPRPEQILAINKARVKASMPAVRVKHL